MHFFKHLHPAPYIGQRNILRCCHNHPTRQRGFLDHGQLGITSAGRQIHDENVQLSPFYIADELSEQLVNHRPTPDNRLVIGQQKPHRHDFQIILAERNNFFVFCTFRPLLESQHQRHTRPVHVSIQNTYPFPHRSQGSCQIDRNCRLANPTLTTRNRYDVLNAGNLWLRGMRMSVWLWLWLWLSWTFLSTLSAGL